MEVLRFNNASDAERAAREILCQCARQAVAESDSFSLGLSGGSTPEALYRLLARDGLGVDWRLVRLVQVDERMVPPGDPANNADMIRRTLLATDDTEDLEFHSMPTLLRGTDAANAYNALLHGILSRPDGQVALDCAIMGMGPDGHTASIFPWPERLGKSPASAKSTQQPDTSAPDTLQPAAPQQDAQPSGDSPSEERRTGSVQSADTQSAARKPADHQPKPSMDFNAVAYEQYPGMAPLVPRLTLTRQMLGHTNTLVYYVNSKGKEQALERVLRGDSSLPAATIRGSVRTAWIVYDA